MPHSLTAEDARLGQALGEGVCNASVTVAPIVGEARLIVFAVALDVVFHHLDEHELRLRRAGDRLAHLRRPRSFSVTPCEPKL